MTEPLKCGAVGAAVGLVVVLSTWAATAASVKRGNSLVLVNESSSLSRGVYLRTDANLRRGSIVATPQPGSVRPYLRGLGVTAGMPLLKRVAAVGGDPVCREADAVVTPLRRATALERDGRGVELPQWLGCRTLGAGEVFLLGDTETSFDSRYFGPIRREAITGPYREIWEW